MSNKLIYLDYNATTPLDPQVLEAMIPYYSEKYGNPASSHPFGKEIKQCIRKASESISELLGCESSEIYYTSGATESINLILKGIAFGMIDKGNHIITCKTEHKATLDSCRYLESVGFDITYLNVDSEGLIDVHEFEGAIRSESILAAIMFANNETGVIQNINELTRIAHTKGIYFFTDATQAIGKIPFNTKSLDVDFMAFSGHKIYGPKGMGGLFVKKELEKLLIPQIHGGGHQNGLRSGTLNVPGIIGLGKAAEIVIREETNEIVRITKLKDELELALQQIEGARINGARNKRIGNTINISYPNMNAEALIGSLKDLSISNGSACTSSTIEPSHVLVAMGLDRDLAFGSLRISLGRFTTKLEIEKAKDLLINKLEIITTVNA